MSAEDRAKWNARYRDRAGDSYPRPDLLLLDYTPPLPPNRPGRALDLAGGVGQNGLWLAEQGYVVDIMDISRAGLDRARTEMAARKIRAVNLLCVDLDHTPLPTDTYDVVCVFRYLNRALLPSLLTTVRSGGRLIYETFSPLARESRPDLNPDYCLAPGELASAFPKWRVLRDTEDGVWAQFVAIKP